MFDIRKTLGLNFDIDVLFIYGIYIFLMLTGTVGSELRFL